jgi:hypothetical protein
VFRPPWKARCYAFRAFHPADKRRRRPWATDGNLVFGGPLLGGPDRQPRTAAGSPTCAVERGAIASLPPRPSLHAGSVQARSRCASRARVRARADCRPSPRTRLSFAARPRRPSAAPAKCRRPSLCRLLADLASPSTTRPSAGMSKPRLRTTWDIFRSPRRPRRP